MLKNYWPYSYDLQFICVKLNSNKSEYNLESNAQKDSLHVVSGRSLFIAYGGGGGVGYAMIKFMIPPHWQWIGGQSSIVLPYTLLETTDHPPFLKTMCPHPPIKEKKEEEFLIPRW